MPETIGDQGQQVTGIQLTQVDEPRTITTTNDTNYHSRDVSIKKEDAHEGRLRFRY